jgi:hypothetical protein
MNFSELLPTIPQHVFVAISQHQLDSNNKSTPNRSLHLSNSMHLDPSGYSSASLDAEDKQFYSPLRVGSPLLLKTSSPTHNSLKVENVF